MLSDEQLVDQEHRQLDQSRTGDLETLRAALRGGEPFASLQTTKIRCIYHRNEVDPTVDADFREWAQADTGNKVFRSHIKTP